MWKQSTSRLNPAFPLLRVLDHFGSDASIYMLIDMAIWGNRERLPHTNSPAWTINFEHFVWVHSIHLFNDCTTLVLSVFVYLPDQTIKSIEKKEPGTKRSGKIFTAVLMVRYHAISVGFANWLLQQIENWNANWRSSKGGNVRFICASKDNWNWALWIEEGSW